MKQYKITVKYKGSEQILTFEKNNIITMKDLVQLTKQKLDYYSSQY